MTDQPLADDESAPKPTNGVSPPYVSFGTFWAFVEDLAGRGPLPQVIEDSAITNVKSPGGRFEVVSALKFFGLVDKDRKPPMGGPGREFLISPSGDTLRPLLEDRYRSVIGLNLATATAGQVDGALTEMGAKNSVNKCRRFFVAAAQKAGIEIGPHLRAAPASPQRPRRAKPRKVDPPPAAPGAQDQPEDLKTAYIKMLMDKASKKEDTDVDLLDRIEKMLGA